MENRQILASKLKPPKLRYVLDRPRLLRMVSPASTYKYVSLCAGPGYGKTTLMAQIARFYPGSHVWYQVDNIDKDPAVLLKHIISGVSQLCEEIGPRSLARLTECSDAAVDGNSVLAVLADEISEHLKAPLAVCFDDFHLFEGTDFVLDFMTTLINELPSDCTVFISSRTKPRLKLGKMRTRGAVLELRQKELQFSLEELRELLSQTWNIDLDDSTLENLHKNTEGWAAGLVLMEDYLRSGIAVPEIMSGTKVKRNVYEYLAEEVLSRQSERLRNLLEMCSLIDPVDPHICQEALGIQDAPALLDMAEKMNLFTTRVGETNMYRFHPLFREILANRLEEKLGKKEVQSISNMFGRAYDEAGDQKKAIEQYLNSKEYAKASSLIEVTGKEMLDNGEHITLNRWLCELAAPLSLTLELFRAQLFLSSGKPHDALNILQIVQRRTQNHDQDLHRETSIVIAECYCMIDSPKKGIDEIEPLLGLDLTPETRVDLLYRLSSCYWSAYEEKGVTKCIEEARNIVKEKCSPNLLYKADVMLAGMCLRNGEFLEAERLLTTIINAEGIESSHKNRYVNNLASCLTMLGKYEESKTMVEYCIEMVKKQKEAKRLMAIYDTYGCCLAALDRWDEAETFLKKSLELRHELDAPVSESSPPQFHLGSFARRRGEYTIAIDYHSKSLEIANSVNCYYDAAVGTVNLGADYLRMGQFSEADRYLDIAKELAAAKNFRYLLTHVEFHKSWLYHLQDDNDLKLSHLSSALARAKKYQHNNFIIQEGKISLPLFKSALENDIEPSYVCWILEKIGPKSLAVVEKLVQDGRKDIRARCANLLRNLKDPSAMSLARRLARDEEPEVRKIAVHALEKLRAEIKAPDELLTLRENQVIEMISQGLSNNVIAKKLFLSERTVKTHVTNIFRKLGLTNRLEAALYFQKISKK